MSLDRASNGTDNRLTIPAAQPKDNTDLLITALENPKFDWRTIRGIARETGLSEDQVEDTLSEMPNIVVQSSDENGKPLFTTRKHYDQRESLGRKILSAIADKIK